MHDLKIIRSHDRNIVDMGAVYQLIVTVNTSGTPENKPYRATKEDSFQKKLGKLYCI